MKTNTNPGAARSRATVGALGALVLASCESVTHSSLALLSDVELAQLGKAHYGMVDEQRPELERELGREIAVRARTTTHKDWGHASLWLTAEQRLDLCQLPSGPAAKFMMNLWGLAGPFAAEVEALERLGGRLGESPPKSALVAPDVQSGARKLSRSSVPNAATLHRLLTGSESGGEWPDDSKGRVCRFACREQAYVVGLLRSAVVGGDDPLLRGWAAAALIRMGKWDPALLREPSAAWDWEVLRGYYLPGVRWPDACWNSCRAALQNPTKQAGVVRDLLRGGAGQEELAGYWMALTGERCSLPSRVNVDWESVPLHAKMRLLDGANLAESGSHWHGEQLFWGVREGVFASGVSLDGELATVAWRAGCMVELLRHAKRHGGAWFGLAQQWLADQNGAAYDLDLVEFERRLRGLLSNEGLVARWSPLCDCWFLAVAG